MFKLFFITNRPDIALIAEKAGVNRIWIDLEVLGKEERQKGLNTVKSKHTIEDIKLVSNVLSKSSLMVRINPWNDNSQIEIDNVISAGAEIIMLPYWRTKVEVQYFIDYIDNRAKTNLLLETKEAVDCVDSILELDGIDEIHIGLNDLSISYGFSNMFEPYANGLLEQLSHKFKNKNVPFGIGGIGKIGGGFVPSPEQLLAEQHRIGSTATILSRSFLNTEGLSNEEIDERLSKNVNALRATEININKMDKHQLDQNHDDIVNAINLIVNMESV